MLIGEILIEKKICKPEDIREALTIQEEKDLRIGELLVLLQKATEAEVAQALSTQLNIPYLPAFPEELETELVDKIPINFAKTYSFIPLYKEGSVVWVATSEPLELFALDDLRILLNAAIAVKVAPHQKVLDQINKVYSEAGRAQRDLDGDLDSSEEQDDGTIDIIEDTDDDAPIIRFVNNLLFRAVNERASDIHIEPMEKELVVRLRIDGVLYEVTRPPKAAQASITSRVKIMGNLNIAEKRLPQDGRIRIKVAGKDIDIRLSTLPTSHGERIVMRLLDRSAVLLEMTQLGFSARDFKTFGSLVEQPNGIILVTGPTGSGKTTTLYSALSKINTPDKNLITVEDPVEYQLTGIGQIPVNSRIGMTFARGLRAILRQDPDVIMVGEIRDVETAEIAIQSSLTGHLVLSTIHTNDAPSSITRMIDMGVEPFLVASSLIGILAQRLVRVACPQCREAYDPTDEELANIGLDRSEVKAPFYRAVGCPACTGKGYSGRKGIYELLVVNEAIQSMILQSADVNDIRRKAISQGMRTLRMDGVDKIMKGITTVEEVLRVTQDQIVTEEV